MKKRSKASKATIIFDQPDAVITRPPGAPPDYEPPSPADILSRLQQINSGKFSFGQTVNPVNQTNSFNQIPENSVSFNSLPANPEPDNNNKTLDILSRLKAISNGDSLPVPTAMPKIEILPTVGVEFDSLTHIDAPKPDNPIAAIERLQYTEEPEESPVADAASLLNYDKPLGFGLCRAMDYIVNHGLYIEHKGDDEQIIEYRDDEGNLIDAKAAFKHQSHIFSGQKPGLKMRMKRQAKNRALANRDNFQVGDTPLHMASSLRNALSEKKQPFLELTGEKREIIPYEIQVSALDAENKKEKEKKKKRLKIRTKKRAIELKEKEEAKLAVRE
ncbi:hypothetical protein TRFO_13269 [Tritrichomonas foetus]|uniref:Uncharacterized protein n=1 Tax=Tritrichomonas foetus TaxID=1144522 RepID=A0A1J4KZH1_9EUKA|nr:hypothetical protein TRFO_13269 [Tritrichomonas foetus]|eukprot:OHT16264.1 hypothetical protein TRFO_13269 [Tritrichomonas foetus]